MKEINVCVLICLVVLLCSVSTAAVNDQEIRIQFSELKGDNVNLSLTPLHAAPKIIHFKINNPKGEVIKVKVDIQGDDDSYIEYQLYDRHPSYGGKYIITDTKVNNPFKTNKKSYNGWLKMSFNNLNEEWWKVKAGKYNYRISFSIKKEKNYN